MPLTPKIPASPDNSKPTEELDFQLVGGAVSAALEEGKEPAALINEPLTQKVTGSVVNFFHEKKQEIEEFKQWYNEVQNDDDSKKPGIFTVTV